MRGLIAVVSIVGLVIMGNIGVADAGQLQTDYETIVSKRKSLEAKRGQYEKDLKELSNKRSRLVSRLHECVSENWKEDFWETRLGEAKVIREKLEDERLEIVKLRINIDKARRTLEKRRVKIEKTHRSKKPGSEYEKAFRQYMKDLETDYFTRLEAELFTKYEEYMDGVRAYLSFLTSSMKICQKDQTTGQ